MTWFLFVHVVEQMAQTKRNQAEYTIIIYMH